MYIHTYITNVTSSPTDNFSYVINGLWGLRHYKLQKNKSQCTSVYKFTTKITKFSGNGKYSMLSPLLAPTLGLSAQNLKITATYR